MRIRNLIFALLLPITFLACAGNGHRHTADTPRGSIAFSSLHSANTGALLKGAASVAQAATATTTTANVFNFGNIPSTETYLFQIQNTGTAEVDNVVVTTDNPAAIVTPGDIAVLPVQGTSSIVPITQVQVIHGIGQNGYGRAALLPPGNFAFHLTATGKDTQGNTVTATCEVDLYAQVAKMQITDYAGVDLMVGTATQQAPQLTSSLGEVSSPSGNVNIFPLNGWYYLLTRLTFGTDLDPTKANYTISNLGNVPLTVTDFGSQWTYSGTYIGTTSVYTVGVGETKTVNIRYNPTTSDFLRFQAYELGTPLVVNSQNVVWDSSYPADGSGNFFLEYHWTQTIQ